MNRLLYILTTILLSLTLVSCMSESGRFKQQIKVAAPVLNGRLPISNNLGSLTKIYLEGDTLCTLLDVSKQIGELETMRKHEDVLVDAMLIQMASDTIYRELNGYLQNMGQYGLYLRIRVHSDKAKEDFRTLVSPARLDSIFSQKLSERELARKRVEAQMILTQMQLPYQVDDRLTMTQIAIRNNEICMQYSVTEGGEINLANADVRTTAELIIRQRLWNEMMQMRDAAMQQMIRDYSVGEYTLKYVCLGDRSNQSVTINFTAGDLRLFLSHYGMLNY